jgi:hypothetical protein
VGGPGVGNVERSFAESISIRPRADELLRLETITTRHAVDTNRDSRRLTIAVGITIATVENDGNNYVEV